MHPGGAESALIGMLSAIDYTRYQVDLFLNRHEGDFMEQIPAEVNLLPINAKYASFAEPITTTIQRGQIPIAVSRLIGKIIARYKTGGAHTDGGITGDYSHRYTKWALPVIQPQVEYDLAISFMTPHYFVAEKCRAKVKAAWIHTDYKQIVIDKESQIKMWAPYDRIIAVSADVANSFKDVFPTLTNKIQTIENILPIEYIYKQSEIEVSDFPDDGFKRLLSVGRFSYPKNFDNIPAMCKHLLDLGLKVKWYIIGYGSGESSIREAISANGMENHVIILGKRANPYPYLKQCDLYVQPSRYEGKAVTVREAQALGKPVVITRFPTSGSQLADGIDGMIVPLDNEKCAEAIGQLLQDTERMAFLSNNCKKRDYSNKAEISKIYAMMEGCENEQTNNYNLI